MAGYGTGVRVPIDGQNPLMINGCALWLRADQGITLATGVSQWNDLSGNGRVMAQGTGSAQPSPANVNGQPSLRFVKASSQFLVAASSPKMSLPMDVFVVGQLASSTAGQQAFYDKGDSGDGHQNTGYFQTNSSTINLYGGVGFSAQVPDATQALCIYRFSTQNANSVIYRNGSVAGTGTSGDPGPTNGSIGHIGSNISGASNLDGWISEIIEYSRILSPSEASAVTRYLGARYVIGVVN